MAHSGNGYLRASLSLDCYILQKKVVIYIIMVDCNHFTTVITNSNSLLKFKTYSDNTRFPYPHRSNVFADTEIVLTSTK